MAYTIGLDYGTNSVRCVIVDTSDGNEVGTAVFDYPAGDAGIILDVNDHNLARQNPVDYIEGLERTVKEAVLQLESLLTKLLVLELMLLVQHHCRLIQRVYR